MAKSYHYALEKLRNAVRTLAVAPGDVRNRLIKAYLQCHTLDESHFPSKLKKKWRFIEKNLTKSGPVCKEWNGELWIGSVENTMDHIYNKTGTKIARQVYDLYETLLMLGFEEKGTSLDKKTK